jgi:hypothetical protein
MMPILLFRFLLTEKLLQILQVGPGGVKPRHREHCYQRGQEHARTT